MLSLGILYSSSLLLVCLLSIFQWILLNLFNSQRNAESMAILNFCGKTFVLCFFRIWKSVLRKVQMKWEENCSDFSSRCSMLRIILLFSTLKDIKAPTSKKFQFNRICDSFTRHYLIIKLKLTIYFVSLVHKITKHNYGI